MLISIDIAKTTNILIINSVTWDDFAKKFNQKLIEYYKTEKVSLSIFSMSLE